MLTACTSDLAIINDGVEQTGKASLSLNVTSYGRPCVATRAVDNDLTVDIIDEAGEEETMHFAAGTIPEHVILTADKTYRIVAYTDNQDNWMEANEGRGEGCYRAETTVCLPINTVETVNLDVKMTNYAVALVLPDRFGEYFKSHALRLKSDGRVVSIEEGQKAYFAVKAGFDYSLSATNTDDLTYSHINRSNKVVEAGKRYTLHYSFTNVNDNDYEAGMDSNITIDDDWNTVDDDFEIIVD